jgi:5'-nucleotidase (lipoprotein e(P4) family)
MNLRLLTLVMLLGASGCATVAQPPVPAPSVTPPAVSAEHVLPESIRWVRASAEHRALFLQVYRAASERVRALASERAPASWAVILDADETIIDNSTYQVRRAAQGLGFEITSWNAWVREEKATALPGAADFLMLVRSLGGRNVIVTNRDDSVCPETRRNLQALGLHADMVLCRPEGQSDKNLRFQSVETGTAAPGFGPMDVLMWIGDNIQDFPALTQGVRDGPESAFSSFGQTYFVLPNPMYGSWERNPVP